MDYSSARLSELAAKKIGMTAYEESRLYKELSQLPNGSVKDAIMKLSSAPCPRTVVLDVDDVMWPLNMHICKKNGVEFNKIVTYSIHENTLMNDDEKNAMIESYTDPDLCREMPMSPEAVAYAALARDPAWRAIICSKCMTQKHKDDKEKALSSFFGNDYGLFEHWWDMAEQNSLDHTFHKSMPENAFALIDDSPFNLLASDAEWLLAPCKPWNRSEHGRKMLRPVIEQGRLIYFSTPQEAVGILYALANGINWTEVRT